MTFVGKRDVAAYTRIAQRIAGVTSGWANGAKLPQIRAEFDELLAGPEPARVTQATLAGLAAITAHPAEARVGASILFLHGGGFQIGSLNSHRSLVSRLAHATRVPVTAAAYRLAPEHRYPAAIDDCLAAYRALVEDTASRIVIAGDSAGGYLTLDLALKARDQRLPQPAGLVLISPWLDLALRGDSYTSRAEVDIFSKGPQLRAMARTYLGRDIDPANPAVCPLDAPLAGLPPIHIEAGDADITCDDSVTLQSRVTAAGGACTLHLWPGMFHHFQVFADLPEAGLSLEAIATAVDQMLSSTR